MQSVTNITDFINIAIVSCPSNALKVVECIILVLASGESRFAKQAGQTQN